MPRILCCWIESPQLHYCTARSSIAPQRLEKEMAATIQGKMIRPQVMGVALLLFLLLFSASSMAQRCKGKSAWPELVGKKGSTAEAIIKAQNPNVGFVFPVLKGSIVDTHFDCIRVFVWVLPNGIIYRVPRVG